MSHEQVAVLPGDESAQGMGLMRSIESECEDSSSGRVGECCNGERYCNTL